MWRVQNYNVFKEISKVSTSWQVAKTAGLIMSQKWLSLVFILITRVLKNVFSMWSKELQSGSKKHNQTKSTRFLQMRSWHYHKTSRYNVSCTSEKTEKFPQISDVKVYLQTVKIELATVTSIWLVIPLFRHYQSLDDGILYVHLARALTWDNSDIISSPVDGEFQIGILSIQHPAAWRCLGVRERMVKPESSGIDSKRGDLLSEIFIETTRFHTAKPKVKRTTPRGLRGLLSGYNV